MGTKIEYVDSNHLHATNYIRNSKAIAVLWAIFTICYAIISAVAFFTPEWVGDLDSENAGRLGLWQVCQRDETSDNCQKQLADFLSIPSIPFQVATAFVGLSVVTAVLTILFLVFLFFLKSTTVFHICGWMQILSAISMIVGCVAFPFGWNSNDFRKICGPESNRFELGLCGIRWAYPLAIIGCIDACILATLAFILATRHVRLQPEPMYQNSMFKGEVNNAYLTDAVSIAGSRKSLNLQPVLLVAPPHHMQTANGDDSISQFSNRTSSRYNHNRPDFHNSMHHFQL
ncbi:LHFPL tetraspan subfamily member 3 protein [Contarinia nasturtii]|uniref:LHFPL tetraspan subfamily member 3 protein n=1 Tax=Contarinia nasturtii TaxID=265458 RepID=UPI0012D38DF2|nr:LHFPL tetraspan subfamily member 3 protein [Contarinia nasturtii]XP_031618321.1 LHFPL tetraspan subfamily member 3 protein [Contarinia nasturtii]XP_031618322.1 LHFPL tetraspan subfamily member 3 protein [Contarinia nasturtii]XP_031618323.1 LHFPL tetraspan subfamily member 3 protein [Contarinia nasturtii]XP_031618324.1 LHFPL tetraspan subfamily member 3 protein [Contarinia nasturtii]